MSMDTFIFEQRDGRLLECVGERVGRVSTERAHGAGSRRWHHIQLIRTDDGRYVLAIQYLTRCFGEQFRAYAWIGSKSELETSLDGYSPDQDVSFTNKDKAEELSLEDIKGELAERFAAALPRVLRGFSENMSVSEE